MGKFGKWLKKHNPQLALEMNDPPLGSAAVQKFNTKSGKLGNVLGKSSFQGDNLYAMIRGDIEQILEGRGKSMKQDKVKIIGIVKQVIADLEKESLAQSKDPAEM